MNTTAESIKAFATRLPEGATISAKELLHLGERAAVDQALSRLVRRGELMRVKRGLFALPVKTRFGERAPSVQSVVEHIVQSTGETVSASGTQPGRYTGRLAPAVTSSWVRRVSSYTMSQTGNCVHRRVRRGTLSGQWHIMASRKPSSFCIA